MKKNHYIFLLTLLLLLVTCKKNKSNIIGGIDTTQLPPATMNGANTMGCLINGEVWLPLVENTNCDLVYDISFTITGPSEGGGGFIKGSREYDDFFDGMNVVIDTTTTTGIYPIPDWVSENVFWRTQCGSFYIDSTYSNTVEITRIDFEDQIISGFYQMRVISQECDTLTITEGRFDLSP